MAMAMTLDPAADRDARRQKYAALVMTENRKPTFLVDWMLTHYNTVQNQYVEALTKLVHAISLYIVKGGYTQINVVMSPRDNTADELLNETVFDVQRNITTLQMDFQKPGTVHHVRNQIRVCRKYKLLYAKALQALMEHISESNNPESVSVRFQAAGYPTPLVPHFVYQQAKLNNVFRALMAFNQT